jgi:hypothetical protein
MGRLLRRLGVRRGLLLEDEAFNDRFRVTTDDEDFALTLLDPEMQRYMTEKTNVTWHLHPGRAALIYSGAMRPERLEMACERLRGFWERVPPELEGW